jgi:hypothetical protein
MRYPVTPIMCRCDRNVMPLHGRVGLRELVCSPVAEIEVVDVGDGIPDALTEPLAVLPAGKIVTCEF